MNNTFSFGKNERLCSKKLIDRLFTEGNHSIGIFPIRLVWLEVSTDVCDGIKILVSVPKRHFRHAVDRNRIKRQIREFYRLNSGNLKNRVRQRGSGLLLGFLFTDSVIWESARLKVRLQSAVDRLISHLNVENGSV